MPQIYDMGLTALLPLRRKACWGIFRPKNPTASVGFEPANLGTKSQNATPRPPKPISCDSHVKIYRWNNVENSTALKIPQLSRISLLCEQFWSSLITSYYHNHLRRSCYHHVKNYKRQSIKNSTTLCAPILLLINTKTERSRYEHADFMKQIYVSSNYGVGLIGMRHTVSWLVSVIQLNQHNEVYRTKYDKIIGTENV